MHLIISSGDTNKRIDKFLSELTTSEEMLNNLSRGDIIRQIKAAKVLVNDLKVKPSYRLNEGDELTLNIKEKKDKIIINSKVEIDVVYEDENIVVINKEAGVQIHPDYNEKHITLLNGIVAKYPEILDIKEENSHLPNLRPGVVHRLDKDTSGIVVIARNQKVFNELKKMFQDREIEKKYLAIVYGTLVEKSGTIDKPLARTSNYRRQTVAGKKTKTKIREAVTEYKVSRELEKNLSLLEVWPKTGRTHQIRVHLFSIGHPIVGDKLYKSKTIKKIPEVEKQLLHASEIKFTLFGEKYEFSAKEPDDFKYFLK
jgi:23S rRNA pseudouridine1911/1915/1917 synthase